MPSNAVTMKLVDVFIIETCVADVPLAKAVVNSDHICIRLVFAREKAKKKNGRTYDAVEHKVQNEEHLLTPG